MSSLSKLKRRLGVEDALQDDLLTDLLEDASDHFKAITGAEEVPEELQFIITDVAEKRYVRKGSAGVSSETVDGYAVSFKDGKSDFDEYMDLLDRRYNLNDQRRKGWVIAY